MRDRRCRLQTEILPWAADDPRTQRLVLETAVDFLQRGEVVAYPTETVYGLAVPAFREEAVEKVFTVKRRSRDKPLLVAVRDREMLAEVASSIPPEADRLVREFWPGPLSLILPRSGNIPDAVTAGGDYVGVRCPDHPAAQGLIAQLGEPITSPSANLSGNPSGCSSPEILRDLSGRIAAIIDAGIAAGTESTLVDLCGDVPRLLRRGAIDAGALIPLLGDLEEFSDEQAPAQRDILLVVCTGNTCRSPVAAEILNGRLGGIISAESAGIAAEPGSGPAEEAVRAADALGYDITGHRARGLDDVAWDRVAMVITMTHLHAEQVRDYLGVKPDDEGAARILPLGDLVTREDLPADVTDPFGGTPQDYRDMAGMLEDMICDAEDEILRRLSEEGAK